MLNKLKGIVKSAILLAKRLKFHLLFKSKPKAGEYCNSKLIYLYRQPTQGTKNRPYLAIIRCGVNHSLIDDCGNRNFDIALNPFASPNTLCLEHYEYLYAGGMNKYKAAYQFLNDSISNKYKGFIFLDDDVEITYSHLNDFLEYCSVHGFRLAQPSLSHDSFFSHRHLVNASKRGWRFVRTVEVMCPYFSNGALNIAIRTFDLSYSTWGLDIAWSRLFDFDPVVVDEFTIKHTQPTDSSGAFYRYMRRIGVSPQQESKRLRGISVEKLRKLTI